MADKTSKILNPGIVDEVLQGFINPNSKPAAEALGSPEARQVLAVSDLRGNNLTEQPGIGKDLVDLPYEQLLVKYGPQVANNRAKLLDTMAQINEMDKAGSSLGDHIKDDAAAAGSALVSISGNTVGAGVGYGLGKLFLDEQTNGNGGRVGMAATQELTQDVSGWVKDFQSDTRKGHNLISAIEGELDSQDSKDQLNADLKAGETPFFAGLKAVGRDTLNAGQRILSDPQVAEDTIAQALGSLGPSAKFASLGGKLASGMAARAGMSASAQAITKTAGIAAGVGATEASGVYGQTVNEVMSMDQKTVEQSSIYQALLAEGHNPVAARYELAGLTAETAALKQLPTAAAIGLISSKFAATPFKVFKEGGVANGLRTLMQEGTEEALQGGSGQLYQNMAVQQNVDPTIKISDGVGEQFASGAIGGVGMAGAMAAPAAALGAVSKTVQGIQGGINNATEMASDAVSGAASKVTNAASMIKDLVGDTSTSVSEKIQPIIDQAKPYVDQAMEKVSPVVSAVSEKAAPILQTMKDRATQVDAASMTRAATSARDAVLTAQTIVKKGLTAPAVERMVQPDSAPIPDGLIQDTGSFLGNVSQLAQSLSDSGFKPNQAHIAYAASQFVKLKNSMADVPEVVRGNLVRVMNSPQVKSVMEKVQKIDLNQTQTETTEITPDVVSETVSVARVNPANVNPVVASKILQQSGENLSKEDIRLMKGASKIASIVNNRTDAQVQIEKDKAIGLSKISGEAPTEFTGESVSRSLYVEGYTNLKGKKLRSINDFAADIFQAAQSPNKSFVGENGVPVHISKLMNQFGNLVQHMENKVSALNESFDKNNERGVGPRVPYSPLVNGSKFIPVEESVAEAFYHRSNPKSVANARMVAENLNAAVQVYNELRKTFPEDLGSFPELKALALREETAQPEAVSEANQETQPTSQTIDDSVLPKAQTEEEPIQNQQKDDLSSQYEKGMGVVLTDNEDNYGSSGSSVFVGNDPVVLKKIIDKGAEKVSLDGRMELNPETKKVLEDNGFDTSTGSDVFYKTKPSKTIEEESVVDERGTAEVASATEAVTSEKRTVSDEPVKMVPKKADRSNLHPTFAKAYTDKNSNQKVESATQYLEMVKAEDSKVNPQLGTAVSMLLKPMFSKMNKAVSAKLSKVENGVFGKTATVAQHLKDGNIQTLRRYRNLALVDVSTGKYDPTMFGLATIALVDWISQARGIDPRKVEDELDGDLAGNDIDLISEGLPISQVKDQLGAQILRMWDVKVNPDATLAEAHGIVEGFAMEMIKALSEMKNSQGEPLVEIVPLKVMKDGKEVTTSTLKISGLQELQDMITEGNSAGLAATSREFLFGDKRDTYSIGEKIKDVDSEQTRSGVNLSKLERAALKNMQDTPHFKDVGRSSMVEAMGWDAVARLLGYDPKYVNIKNKALLRAEKGRALGIQKNIREVEEILSKVQDGETPVYYPVGVTKVGRHQYQGPNPQSNKLLRMLVTPTWSTLSFSKEDMDKFWITVAQAAGLKKVEKNSLQSVLDTVEGDFNAKYRPAVDLIKDWLKGEDLNGEALVSAVLEGAKASEVEPQILAAIHAVAEMEFFKENGATDFRTSLSFELDGLTNGAANMMINYGRGLISQKDFKNFQRVGFFLGLPGKTVNDFFSARGVNGEKNFDLYEETSRASEESYFQKIKSKMTKPFLRKEMIAAGNFAAHFGNFKVKGDSFEMTRNTAKNPMTKVNYGSGVSGVGIGVAKDMVLEFYRQIQGIPDDVKLDEYFGYPTIYEDIEALFGVRLPRNLNGGAYEFPAESLARYEIKNGNRVLVGGFNKVISRSIGQTLTDATKSVIGDEITKLNDMLVFSTNVQSQYLRLVFQSKLEALAEQRMKEGKIRPASNGKPMLSELTVQDYKSVVDEMGKLAPIFVSDDQSLAIGGFSKAISNMVLSEDMDSMLNQKALLQFPEEVGVKAIPFSVIGSGDAMMMNFIFGSEGAPKDALGIFDGLDCPAAKVADYAPYVNEQVMKTWERDVLGMAVNNFKGFLDKVSNDPVLEQAFALVAKSSESSSTVTSKSPQELMRELEEYHRMNKARKAVFKKISLSVDQMGGSGVGYSRGEFEYTRTQINEMIQQELDGKVVSDDMTGVTATSTVSVDKPVELTEPLTLSDVKATLKGLRMSPDQRAVVAILKDFLPNTKVVFGTIGQLKTHREDNYADDGMILQDVPGQYDAQNDVIYLTTNKAETIIHEMVHAATFSKVLAHYEGQTNEAVERLENLMNEFMETEFKGHAVNEAKGAILRQLAQNDSMSKAAAVNEFMAYALSSAKVRMALKNTETNTIQALAQKVIALMRRIMGGMSTSMFDHVVFNTKVLMEPPTDDGFNGGGDDGGNGNDDGEITPESHAYSNYWINMARDLVKKSEGKRPLRSFFYDAKMVVESFRQVGLLPTEEAQQTFKAIYVLMAAQTKMDPKSVISLTRMFKYIEDNLTAEMFDGDEKNQTYSAVMSSLGERSQNGISDALAVMFALSQTSKMFRDALDKIPAPEGGISEDTLSDFLTRVTGGLTRKLFADVSIGGKEVNETLNNLAESIIDLDSEREFSVMKKVTSSLDAADQFLSGLMRKGSDILSDIDEKAKAESRSNAVKVITGSLAYGAALFDGSKSQHLAENAKRATNKDAPLISGVPFRELISEMIGTDAINRNVVALQDKVNSKIAGMRQAYREDLPVILQDLFKTHPSQEQWASMHTVLAQSDMVQFLDPTNLQASMNLLEESGKRKARIKDLETKLAGLVSKSDISDFLIKADQLAGFMNGEGAGVLLMRNAYAITKNMKGKYGDDVVETVDELVSLYMIDRMDKEVLEETVQLWQNEPKAVAGIITYLRGLHDDEKAKISYGDEAAKLNAYKGYVPNEGLKNTRVVIAPLSDQKEMEMKGFTFVGHYSGDNNWLDPNAYYVTNLDYKGAYSQGAMQNVASTYMGVDTTTGSTIGGTTSGMIMDQDVVNALVDQMVQNKWAVRDPKEALLPVFDSDGSVMGFERAINPDVLKAHLKPEKNLATMIGVWAGRQVEENLSTSYNEALVDELDRIYQNRDASTDKMFVNLKTTDDPIYQEAFSLIPKRTKQYMDNLFDGNGPMIRKDMVNLSVGYREFSFADFWTGKTRVPEEVQKAVKFTTQFFLKDKGMKILLKAEQLITSAVATAKDVIVVRSLAIPALNLQSNVVQLATNGVPVKAIMKGFRNKLAEVEEFQGNISKRIELEAKLRLAASDANQRRILRDQIQVLDDLNNRMTIAPLIRAGAFKNLSEGMTDLDVAITSGKFADYIESKVKSLPPMVGTVVKYGLVSKSTSLYKEANRATQYGDFLAKSIYYDHLIAQGLSEDVAIERVNEEFVNFSMQPGRVRSGLERFGLTWFMAFKLRIMKIALRQMRENPFRALAVNTLLPGIGSPVQDNFISGSLDGSIGYALGPDMLLNVGSMNPWVNLLDG